MANATPMTISRMGNAFFMRWSPSVLQAFEGPGKLLSEAQVNRPQVRHGCGCHCTQLRPRGLASTDTYPPGSLPSGQTARPAAAVTTRTGAGTNLEHRGGGADNGK